MRVGLTGGVGSGKSTVAALLAERGAVVIDADAIAREVVAKGTPGFEQVVARFGADVVGPDGELDRPALASIVFTDEARRAELNEVVHPLVAARVAELEADAPDDAITVYDVPLLVESDLAGGFEFVIVVEAPVPTRLARLLERGMPETDARERMAIQASDADRRAVADVVVANAGGRDELAAQVDRVWRRLRAGGRGAPEAV